MEGGEGGREAWRLLAFIFLWLCESKRTMVRLRSVARRSRSATLNRILDFLNLRREEGKDGWRVDGWRVGKEGGRHGGSLFLIFCDFVGPNEPWSV